MTAKPERGSEIRPPYKDTYDLAALQAACRDIGYDILFAEQTTSTMDMARATTNRNVITLANYQTDGRGRPGHPWYALPDRSVIATFKTIFDREQGDPHPAVGHEHLFAL